MITAAKPSRYTPWMKGRYEVAPNLKPLGTDFGNGSQDQTLIQFDTEFAHYRANKESAYADDVSKYFGVDALPGPVMDAIALAMAQRLAFDYPDAYVTGDRSLRCLATGETVAWTPNGELDTVRSQLRVNVGHLVEGLAFQIQPDLAIVVREPDGQDRVAAVHVCAPSHWRPSEKLGQSFFQTHTVVPGFEKINAVAPKMVEAMMTQGPFIRFVWGAESDTRLNHHPDPPTGQEFEEWDGRAFDRAPFVARVERQTLLGLPEVQATLFIIHAKTIPGSLLSIEERHVMAAAVRSMSPDALGYKGLTRHREALLAQLDAE